MKLMDADGSFPNLKGAAIGDGCWGNDVGLCAFGSGKAQEIQMRTYFGHSMISNQRMASLDTACAPWGDGDVKKARCLKELHSANNEIGDFDVYNLYDTCVSERSSSWKRTHEEWNKLLDTKTVETTGVAPHRHPQLTGVGGALNDYPCGGDEAASKWLGLDSVAEALHVNTNTKGQVYNKGPDDFSGNLLPLYASLMKKYRMLIYSGDTDACVPTWGTVDWIDSLNLTVTKEWTPWEAEHLDTTAKQRAGYTKEYFRRADISLNRGAAAAATWIIHVDESWRRRGRDVRSRPDPTRAAGMPRVATRISRLLSPPFKARVT